MPARARATTTAKATPKPRKRVTKSAQTLAERRKLGKGFTPQQLQQAMHLVHRLAGLPDPEPEYQFARDIRRRWAIDFAWVEARIALELEGGIWRNGRHIRPAGYVADLEKYNELAARGWLLIRATYDMLPTPDLARDSAVLPLLVRAFALRREQQSVA